MSHFEIPNSKFKIRIMEKKDIEESVKIIVEAFHYPTEPLCSFIGGFDRDLFTKFMTLEVNSFIDQKHSLVVYDSTTEEILGCVLISEYGNKLEGIEHPNEIEMHKIVDENKNFNTCYSLVDQLNIPFHAKCKERKITKVLYMPEVAVKKKARGKRIFDYFLQIVSSEGKKKGFELLFGQFTNNFSLAPFLRKFEGFTETFCEIVYDDYEFLEKDKNEKTKPYYGCNDKALEFLKAKGLYKPKFGDDICKKCSLVAVDLKKLNF